MGIEINPLNEYSDTQEFESIRSRILKIKEKFHLDVMFDSKEYSVYFPESKECIDFVIKSKKLNSLKDKIFNAKADTLKNMLDVVYCTLDKYPSDLINRYISTIHIGDIFDTKVGKKILGLAIIEDKTICLGINNIQLSLEETIHHELFHMFDGSDGYLDDDYGRELSDNEALGLDKDFKNNSIEDQAYIAPLLFSGKKNLRSLIIKNPLVKEKIEQLTGCEYNSITGLFISNMELKSYKEKFCKDGYEYYMKRFNGIMDYNYWNNILNKKP